MRRTILAGLALAGLVTSTTFVGTARASETYEKATKMKCEQCHKETKEEFEKNKITGHDGIKNLLKCGKESHEFLKKQPGFKELKPGDKRTPEETKKWALALLRGKWKCSDPNGK